MGRREGWGGGRVGRRRGGDEGGMGRREGRGGGKYTTCVGVIYRPHTCVQYWPTEIATCQNVHCMEFDMKQEIAEQSNTIQETIQKYPTQMWW